MGLVLGTTAVAQANDGWAPPKCIPKDQVVVVPGVTTAMWYYTGGGYSAGRGYLTFDYKAVFYIKGQASQSITGTTRCSL